MRHILTAGQFSDGELRRLFKRADHFRKNDGRLADRQKIRKLHDGRIMLSMFYEPSTRTRFSFEIAAAKLGIAVTGTENAAEFSSAAKGETIEDTVRVFGEYGVDAIVMRTEEEGHAARAAKASSVAILNGGDGKGEHPTQAVLDAYTIHQQFHRLDNLRVVIGGDLKYGRTARSLAVLLSRYKGNHIEFVSLPGLRIGSDIKNHLQKSGTTFNETAGIQAALANADVVYWTRMQLERHDGTPDGKREDFAIGEEALSILPKDSLILHPLPRNHEIPTTTDDDPRAGYFRQAGNGLYVRMAMLDEIMSALP